MKKFILFLILSFVSGFSFSADCTPNQLIDDLANNSTFSSLIGDNPNLVDSWNILDRAGLDNFARTDIDNLSAIDDYLLRNPGSGDDLLAGFSRVGQYTDEFISGIKNSSNDLSHLNGRSGTPSEIADAVVRIKQHRIDVNQPGGGNYGYLDGNVDGLPVDNKMWRSGAYQDGEPQIFEAIVVEGGAGRSWLRVTDSEFKMLNSLADSLNGVGGEVYPNISGSIRIVSENPYCASCQGIIQQFNQMFPNINLVLIDGVK